LRGVTRRSCRALSKTDLDRDRDPDRDPDRDLEHD
jgi:hypothetical protein